MILSIVLAKTYSLMWLLRGGERLTESNTDFDRFRAINGG